MRKSFKCFSSKIPEQTAVSPEWQPQAEESPAGDLASELSLRPAAELGNTSSGTIQNLTAAEGASGLHVPGASVR